MIFECPTFNCMDVGTQAERIQLINQIKKIEEEQYADSNFGCKRYPIDPKQIPWITTKLRYGLTQIVINSNPMYQEMLDYHGYDEKKNPVADAWCNLNAPGARNELHCHEKAQFTAVYFLKAKPNSGELVLKNPANVTNQCHPGAPGVQDIVVEPKEGGLIIFPGWVPHEVWINNSGEERISLAFNLNLVAMAKYLNKGAV